MPFPAAFIVIIITIVHSSFLYALPHTLAALDATSDLSCREAPQHHLWNRQRNYMSLWALTQLFDENEHWYTHGLPMPVLDRDPRWDKGFYDFEYEQALLQEFGAIECPLGWLSAQLLRAPMPARVSHRGFLKNGTDKSLASVFQQIQIEHSISAVLASGWPLFHLLYRFATKFGLSSTRAAANFVACESRAGNATGKSLFHSAFRHPASQCARGVWLYMAKLQDSLLWADCPRGAFAALIPRDPRANDNQAYRMCVSYRFWLNAAYTPQFVSSTIVHLGSWDECSEIPIIRRSLSNGFCTLLDVGANIGACTAWAASVGYSVIAIDPMAANIAMLQATMLLLRKDLQTEHVHIVRAAVAESDADADSIMSCPGGDLSQCHLMPRETLDASELVQQISLDSLMQSLEKELRGWPPLCAMKLDVEGSELRVLQGAGSVLASKDLRAVHFEFVPDLLRLRHQRVTAPAEVLSIFHSHGFAVFAADKVSLLAKTGVSGDEELASLMQSLGVEAHLDELPPNQPSFNMLALRSHI